MAVETAAGQQEQKKKEKRKIFILAFVAAVALLAVTLFGWYQFASRPERAIDMVRHHAVPGTGRTVGKSIGEFIRDRGVKVGTAFVPRWGAEEEKRDDVFTVSYVYEEEYPGGREAKWISWRVSVPDGKVTPLGRWARQLWEGRE